VRCTERERDGDRAGPGAHIGNERRPITDPIGRSVDERFGRRPRGHDFAGQREQANAAERCFRHRSG
jgi:hypothetical protein